MKILILGGTGAIGKSLIPILVNKGEQVWCTSRTYNVNSDGVIYLQGDAHDFFFLQKCLEKEYDVVIDFMIYRTEEFKNRLFLLRNARHDYLHNVAKKLNELGYILNVEELDKIEAVTKAHISLDVINNPNNKEVLLQNFNHIPNKGEFIETVMNEGCPAYVRKETITPKEAANLIRQAGGKAILAHPVAYEHEDNLTDEDILEIVNDMQADGIEANYIYVDCNNNKFDEINKWNDFAIKHGLIVTIGSDFHNKDGIRPEIGFINEKLSLDTVVLENIINNLKNS